MPLPPEAVLGQTRWELANADMLNRAWVAHIRALRAQLPFHLAYTHLSPKGPVRALVVGFPVFGRKAQFLGYTGATRLRPLKKIQQL